MFRRSVTLGRIAGIPLRIDATWLIIAVLVTWSLAAGFFPSMFPDLSLPVYWGMAVAGALGLFASILFHEFAHALVARRFGVPVRSVTLFVFGGVGDLRDEPPTPKAEFWIAIVGPLSSALLAGLAALPGLLASGPPRPAPVAGVLHWLAVANTMLAVFNLVPAFPLDGGRVLRAILWGATGNLRRATRSASRAGGGFGLFLMVLGGLQFLAGNLIGGIWLFFIGLWLRAAASGSYTQLLMKEVLGGQAVRSLMKRDPVTVPPDLTLEAFIHDYVYRHQYKMFPVVEDGRLLGSVTLRSVSGVPRTEWPLHRVAEFLAPCSDETCIAPGVPLLDALAAMRRTGHSRLLVRSDGHLDGLLALKDVMNLVALKTELEEGP